MKVRDLVISVLLLLVIDSQAVQGQIPKVYSNILEDNGFFHVDGDKIKVEVFNPVTLEKFDIFDLN